MAGTLWIPEAEDLRASGSSGDMDGIGGPRATAHVTVSNPGSFSAMHGVLTSKQAEPHVLYDMSGDRLGQYFALNRSARALMGGSGTPTGISHNKRGLVNIQVEICWDPTDGDLTLHDLWQRPRPKWEAFLRAVRSWGIADRFIYRTARTAADKAAVERSIATWSGTAGGGVWWGHCHYDELESHWDPGPLDEGRFFGTGADMALTSDDIAKIWSADVIPTTWSSTDDATNPTWRAAGFFGYLGAWAFEAKTAASYIRADVTKVLAALTTIATDVKAGRLAAEQALAQARMNAEAIAKITGADAAAIEAAVEAGLQKMIDSVATTTVLEVDPGADPGTGPVANAQGVPLKAGLTDEDGTAGQKGKG